MPLTLEPYRKRGRGPSFQKLMAPLKKVLAGNHVAGIEGEQTIADDL